MVKQFLKDDKRRLADAKPTSSPSGSDEEGTGAPNDGEVEVESNDEVIDRPSYIDAERAVSRETPTTEECPAPDAVGGKPKQEKLVDVSY